METVNSRTMQELTETILKCDMNNESQFVELADKICRIMADNCRTYLLARDAMLIQYYRMKR